MAAWRPQLYCSITVLIVHILFILRCIVHGIATVTGHDVKLSVKKQNLLTERSAHRDREKELKGTCCTR